MFLIQEHGARAGRRDCQNTRAGADLEYRLDPDKRVVSVRFGPRLTETGIETYARSLRENSLFDAGFSEIVDLRTVEEIGLSGEQMVELADRVDPYSSDSRRAFVVRNAVQEHAVRMHQILRCAKGKISVCFTMEEAHEWIGE